MPTAFCVFNDSVLDPASEERETAEHDKVNLSLDWRLEMNGTATAGGLVAEMEMNCNHTDSLLRKHQMLLKQEHRQWSLIDWLDHKPVSKERALAYLSDLESNPGFPGRKIATQLRESVESCAAGDMHPADKVLWVSGFLTGTVGSPRNYSRIQLLEKMVEVLNVVGWGEGCRKEIPSDKYPSKAEVTQLRRRIAAEEEAA
jgi:hypothetical protein